MLFRIVVIALVLTVSVLGQEKIGPTDTSITTVLINHRGESDLDIQTRMADAAEDTKFWAVVSGVGAIVVSLLALLFTFREARVSRKQREQELRAYVHVALHPQNFIDGPENLMKFFFHGGDPSKGVPKVLYNFVAENHGQTPARNVTCWRRICVGPYPILGDFKFPEKTPEEIHRGFVSSSPLPPRGKTMLLTGFDARLTQADIDAVRSNKAALYLYGRINYQDVFGRNWETNFRYMHPIADKFFGGEPPAICEAGNETT